MERSARIPSKGRVTIPIEIRERAGLLPHTEVELEFDGEVVKFVWVERRDEGSRGARLIAHLSGRGEGQLTTDEIVALTRGD